MMKIFVIVTTLLAVFCDIDLNGSRPKLPQQNVPIAWTAGWSNDQRYLAVGNDHGEIIIYETISWKKIYRRKYEATTISRLEWNPRYPLLAITGSSYARTDSIVQIYDIEKNKSIYLSDSLQGGTISWRPDGEKLAVAGNKGFIRIYSRKGEVLKTLNYSHPNMLLDIDWHPSKDLILAVEEDIYLIDVAQDSLVSVYDDGSKNKGILSCQWHPSGNYFVTGDYGSPDREPSFIKYWDQNGALIKKVQESKAEIRNLRWNKDGSYLAASGDVLIILNDRAVLAGRFGTPGHNHWGLDWNSTGDQVVTSDQASNIVITDITGRQIKKFQSDSKDRD